MLGLRVRRWRIDGWVGMVGCYIIIGSGWIIIDGWGQVGWGRVGLGGEEFGVGAVYIFVSILVILLIVNILSTENAVA